MGGAGGHVLIKIRDFDSRGAPQCAKSIANLSNLAKICPESEVKMRTFTSATAKNQFGQLIDAARLAPVAITKYDKPFVVVLAVEEFERLVAHGAPTENIVISKKNL